MEQKLMLKYEEPSIEAGKNLPRIEDIWGTFKTVSTEPTHTPRKLNEQVMVYASGAVYRLYAYDTVGNTWRYVALT